MKTKLKPISIFAEIQRVNEEERTIDAYAFVNEVVDGEGGIRLKRTAMEAATPDYMKWANVRRMHQPDAVGVARAVDWDDKGAAMTVEIIDDDAWNKVKRGVYKGLSVGVAATVMRGKDVDACRWLETSLVDRPKDPDAKIIAVRADDVAEEYEVDVIERVTFNEILEDLKEQDLRQDLWDAFYCLMGCINDSEDDLEAMRTSVDQFAAYAKGLIDSPEHRGEFGAILARLDAIRKERTQPPAPPTPDPAPADPALLTRIDTLTTQNTALVARLDAMTTDLAKVPSLEQQLAAAIERISVIERQPVAVKPVVRFPEALGRTFPSLPDDNAPNVEAIARLGTEYNDLLTSLKTEKDEAKRAAGVQRMQELKMQLSHFSQAS